ncbi:MAG: hypothetical protein K0R82_2121 [Flavipsychrobacter sp.]|jgi:ELWxxDGT repeat protein|nr:hypothetical protein [Flavipsychrobacter sp.]
MFKIAVLAISIFLGASAAAQVVQKVADINPTGDDYIIFGMVFNGKLFFQAADDIHGSELWVHDAQTGTTHMFLDINPTGGSSPSNFFIYGGKLLFSANDGSNGTQIWSLDSAGVVNMISNITGPYFLFANRIVVNNKLYFLSSDLSGSDIWETDGTLAGTQRLKDITGHNFYDTYEMTAYNNKIVFDAKNGPDNRELWISDGTASGTYILKDINPYGSSNISSFCLFNNKLYFSAVNEPWANNIVHHKPWVTDGTASGTQMLKDINTEATFPLNFYALSNRLLFTTRHANTSVLSKCWTSDGTNAGTEMLYPIGGDFEYLFTYKDRLFLSWNNQLWVTNGFSNGTYTLKDIQPSLLIDQSVLLYDRLYFLSYSEGPYGKEKNIWSTDGTTSGTVKVTQNANINYLRETYELVEYDNWIYFRANYDGTGYALYRLYAFPTGIDDKIKNGNTVSVYPNPSDGNFSVQLKESGIKTTISVVNTQGQQVYQSESNRNVEHLQLSLPPGIYFLKYQSGDGCGSLPFSVIK